MIAPARRWSAAAAGHVAALRRSPAAEPQSVEDALARFRDIRPSAIRRIMRHLWVGILGLLVFDGVVFYLAGVRRALPFFLLLGPHVPAAAAALLARHLLDGLSRTLTGLWTSGRLRVRHVEGPADRSPLPAEVGERYRDFVREFERWLAGRQRFVFGLLFVALFYVFYPVIGYRWDFPLLLLEGKGGGFGYLFLFAVALQCLVTFVLGIIGWRIVAIAFHIGRLGNRFDFDLDLADEHRSGGLKPLADHCFTIALIWGVAAVYPLGWIIALPRLNIHAQPLAYYLIAILAVTFLFALLTFVLPLYLIHRAMVRYRLRLQTAIDEAGVELARRVLQETTGGTPDQVDSLSKEFGPLKDAYDRTKKIPSWPFDMDILTRFITAQGITLVGAIKYVPTLVDFVQNKPKPPAH
jgi:hypothetical protein